jgi:polar amino acid transport system ATP-binding protein
LRKVLKRSPGDAARTAAGVLGQVGLGDKLNAYPSQLSGGQQQRVAIARSLALAPSLMLFDEITSALDPELIGEVVGVLERLAEQRMTMVIVTHQLGFARSIASRVVFMHQGLIVEDGPSAEIMSNPRTPELKSFLSAVLT